MDVEFAAPVNMPAAMRHRAQQQRPVAVDRGEQVEQCRVAGVGNRQCVRRESGECPPGNRQGAGFQIEQIVKMGDSGW